MIVVGTPYDDVVNFVEGKIVEEGVPTKNPRGLATVMVLVSYWSVGDAYIEEAYSNV